MQSKNSAGAKHAELELFSLSWPIFVEMALFMAIGTLGGPRCCKRVRA